MGKNQNVVEAVNIAAERIKSTEKELKKERMRIVREYKGDYFNDLYYKDILKINEFPHVGMTLIHRRGSLIDNEKSYFNDIEKALKPKLKGTFPKMTKVRTEDYEEVVQDVVAIEERLKRLKAHLKLNVLDDKKSSYFRNGFPGSNISVLFQELELVKKLDNIQFMDNNTFMKYYKFLDLLHQYRLRIESSNLRKYIYTQYIHTTNN